MTVWSGFYKLPMDERLDRIATHGDLDDGERAILAATSSLPTDTADLLIENATGTYPLPLGWAVGFRIDGADPAVPMAVEESSVVAAASHGAKLAAAGGGFQTDAMDPVTIGQVEMRQCPETIAAVFAAHHDRWVAELNAEIPSMVQRGGGVRELRLRKIAAGHCVIHILLDSRDAMGANAVNTLCELLAPIAAEATGATPGLRILSNLATERLVSASCRVPVAAVGGADVAAGIVAADHFAHIDPYRAATHNKGILNGIDPVVIATGNDWRAIEAGAHAYAALDGQYRGLTEWRVDGDHLEGALTLPLSVGTVGGMTKHHPIARIALKVLGNPSATELARIMAAVGLAQNLSALKALATEGIQEGHMRLHRRNEGIEPR